MFRLKILSSVFLAGIIVLAALNYFDSEKNETALELRDLSSKILNVPAEHYNGITPFQYDDDPDLEYILSGLGVANVILKNSDFNLSRVNNKILEDRLSLTKSLTACDLDGDGFNELFALNISTTSGEEVSKNRLFKRVNGQWQDIIGSSKLSLGVNGGGAICLDRNGDGKFEIFVFKSNAPSEYLVFDNYALKDIAAEIGIKKFGISKTAIVVPDGNGLPHIFIGNEDGPNFFLKNIGDSGFIDFSSESGMEDPDNDARGISLIDINNDNFIDIVFGNNSGPLRVFIQKGHLIFEDITPEILKGEFFVNALAVADFDLNGEEDLYLNNRTGRNILFLRKEGKWEEEKIKAEFDEAKKVGNSTLVGDIIFDGAIELLNTHSMQERSRPTMYNFRSTKTWINMIPTLKNGAIAKNSLVNVVTSKGKSLKVVSDGSAPFSSRIPQAHFGLGGDEKIFSIEIIHHGKSLSIDPKSLKKNHKNYIKIN